MLLDAIYPTENEKIMLLKGLLRLSKVSDGIVEEEIEFLQNVAIGMELSVEKQQELREAANYALDSEEGQAFFKIAFDTKEKSIFFLREAVQLGYFDGSYDEAEAEEVRKIADELGISYSTVEAIEEWVLVGMQWKAQGELLLSLES